MDYRGGGHFESFVVGRLYETLGQLHHYTTQHSTGLERMGDSTRQSLVGNNSLYRTLCGNLTVCAVS